MVRSRLYLITLSIFFHVCLLQSVHSAEQNDKKIRALLVTVDNRALVENLSTTNYLSLSTVINMQYAKQHSYDCMFIQGRMTYPFNKSDNRLQDDDDSDDLNVLNYILSKYNTSQVNLPQHSTNSKYRIASFNVDLKQFRAASWSKLLVIWNLLQDPKISEKYDYIFLLDSDAILSPLAIHRSLDDFFKDADAPGGFEYGQLPSKAAMVFFSNRPWKGIPCAGTVLFSVRHPLTLMLVKEWWNQDLPRYNFLHDFEQSALRKMILDGHLFIAHMTYLTEQQFTVDLPNQWLLHYSRKEQLIIKNKHLYSNDSFETAMKEVKAKHAIAANLLQIAEDIRRVDYKKHLKKILENFPTPFLVKTKNSDEIFLIHFHMKRFVSEVAFKHWNFNMENVQLISSEALANYTFGPRVTTVVEEAIELTPSQNPSHPPTQTA